MMVDEEDGGLLAGVVAAADAINYAILMENQFEPAVRKLLGAGLVRTQQRRLSPAQGYEGSQARRALRQVDYLVRALQRQPVSEHEWQLLPDELRQEADSWHERAQQILAKHRGPRGSSAGTKATLRNRTLMPLLASRAAIDVTAAGQPVSDSLAAQEPKLEQVSV